MRHKLLFPVIILLLVFSVPGCEDYYHSLSDQEKSLIAEEVIIRMHQSFEDEKSLVVSRMIDIYSEDEDFLFGGDGYLTNDLDYLTESFTDWSKSIKEWLYMNIHDEYVYVLAKDAASYTFDFDWAIETNTGDTLTCKQGSWTFVLKKIEGEWKSVHCNGTHIFQK